MNSQKSSASSQKPSPQTRQSTWSASDPLTPSEIVLLQQSKKSIADYVRKELSARLKQRLWAHLPSFNAELRGPPRALCPVP